MAAAWFGSKDFASVVYGLIVLERGVAKTEMVFALIVANLALSIAVHSATDGPVATALCPADPLETLGIGGRGRRVHGGVDSLRAAAPRFVPAGQRR